MSFSLQAYLIDRSELETVFNSKNEALQNEFAQKYKPDLQELRSIIDLEYSPIEALKDIINGKIQHVPDTEVHAHVVRLFCKYLGKELDNSEWQNLSMYWLMDINQTAELPMEGIPPPKNFPYVISLSQEKLENFLIAMGALETEEAAWTQFEKWIEAAKNEQKDLILFFY